MLREFSISVYLFTFNMIFTMFKLFPQQEKTVCVASFGDNIFYTTRALRKETNQQIIILREPSCTYHFDETLTNILPFQLTKPFHYIRSIYHLATATTILVDNYFGFLAAVKFKEGTTCIQLWHATGALKKFGLEDPSIINRSTKAIRRFQSVYKQFHFIIVGSDEMAAIFEKSFNRPREAMLRIGVPRTDFFYDVRKRNQALGTIESILPSLKGKKVILYAPTFRENQLKNYQIQLDLNLMYKELSEEYIVLIKNHPAVSYILHQEHDEFIYDVTKYYNLNHLLLITDILITDYSSIPCEFSIFNKPIIFFTYDIEEYQKINGIPENYLTNIPGPLCTTTEEVVTTIRKGYFDMEKIDTFPPLGINIQKEILVKI